MPRLLRIHDGPGTEKLLTLKTFLSELGLHLGGGDTPRPLDYMYLLESVKDRKDAHLIQTVLLRSMSQAVYSPDTKGHFGLALDAYAHFTSPIRRYPDLLVHRAIRHCLAGQTPETFHYNFADMVQLGEHCSANERRADEATRDVVNWLKCEYMMDKIGLEFPGIITAVTGFGFFVELQSIYVEGLVHIASLHNDYFNFDATSHQLYGERTGVRYRLGDAVKIKVVRVNLDDKKIDFELIQANKNPGKAGDEKPLAKKPSKAKNKAKAKPKAGKPDEVAKPKAKRRRKS
jgi:ribonuclease R